MKPRHLGIGALTLTLAFAASADAQLNSPTDEDPNFDDIQEPQVSDALPTNHVLRPITLPRLHLRGTLRFAIADVGDDDLSVFMDLNAGFGITDNLEVGISSDRQGLNPRLQRGLIPIRLAPSGGDRFGNISIYGRYRFLSTESFELGGEIGIEIPVGGDFAFYAAVPFRFRLNEMFSLDGGLEGYFAFVDAITETVLFSQVNLSIQPRLAFDALYFGLNTGIVNVFSDGIRELFVPLGIEAGYTFVADPAKIEAFAGFAFPTFIANSAVDAGGMTQTDTDVVVDRWTILFGARAFLDFAN